MDIRSFKTFITIVDQGTFGAAGQVVGLTQSAVSQQIRIMEETFQVKLFDRSVRPPVLTVHGISLLDKAHRIVNEYEGINKSISGDKLVGSLLLGAIRSSLTGALPKALSILRKRYPQLRIHVKTRSSRDLISMVDTMQLDAAIIAGGRLPAKDLRWSPFSVEPLKVIMPAGTKGVSDKQVLINEPYIRFVRDVPISDVINNELLRRNIKINEEMQINSFSAIIQMVSHGLGVSVVPEEAAKKNFPQNVTTLPFGDPPLNRTIGVIDKKNSGKLQIVEALHHELWRISGSPKIFCKH